MSGQSVAGQNFTKSFIDIDPEDIYGLYCLEIQSLKTKNNIKNYTIFIKLYAFGAYNFMYFQHSSFMSFSRTMTHLSVIQFTYIYMRVNESLILMYFSRLKVNYHYAHARKKLLNVPLITQKT
jgi:hypothetical protein